jgi:hypothetical protein
MKTFIKKFATLSLITISFFINAQSGKTPVLTVLNIDSKGIDYRPSALGDLIRIEVEKMRLYNVKDKYDVQQFLSDNEISLENCYGKTCLTEVGKKIGSDKMLTGSFEKIGESIVVTLRLIDVKNSEVENTYVHEYLYIPSEVPNMVKLSVAQMFNKEFDENLMNKLTKRFEFNNSYNNPNVATLKLDGPRMGFVSYTGTLLKRITDKEIEGGYDAFPVMFQLGYQFEKQYLNEGNVQGLFEFIPMVTGLDQSLFIPSAAILHGIRSNVSGWEFAFGPSFNIVTKAKGYFDGDNKWHRENEWYEANGNTIKNPHPIEEQLDRRGNIKLQTSFLLAAGRTFKSGRLNIPVNVYVVPGKSGLRYGVSIGFNARNNK